jgi:hypothetical protein
VVTRVGYNVYRSDSRFKGIEIKTPDGMTVKMFYVIAITGIQGRIVGPGSAVGTAQDLHMKYSQDMTNHVHVKVNDSAGRLVDPTSLLPMP